MADRYLQSLPGESEGIILVTRQYWLRMVNAILLEVILTIVILVGVTFGLTLSPLAAIGYVLLICPVGRGLYEDFTWRAAASNTP